ncbi:MAG: TRAP transporter small permease [Rhodoferax sp.]|nr:TRAP transporter small permease [Rhodoferax sp.]
MRTPLLVSATAVAVRLAALLSGAAFAAFCVLTLVQVVNRYAIGGELYWTEEVVILLFVWSVMTGVPVALWSRNEIVVDLLQLPPGLLRRLQQGLAELASIGFLAVLTWSGLQLIEHAGAALSPALELPRWLFYSSIPVGAALGALALIGRWWRDAAGGPPTLESDYVADAHD